METIGSTASRRPQPRFGELLLRAGVITEAQLEAALAEQRAWGGKLGRILIDQGAVDERTMCLSLSRQLGLPCVDLAAAGLPASVTELLSIQVCERLGVMPLGLDAGRRVLRVATADPTNSSAIEELKQLTGMSVEAAVATATDIDTAVRHYYYGEQQPQVAIPGFSAFEPQRAPPKPPQQTAAAPASAEPALVLRVSQLEELAARQARALRVLVEMLVETRQLDREAFQRRARGEKG